MKLTPLTPEPATESISALAYAITRRWNACRELEAAFDREVALSSAWRRIDDGANFSPEKTTEATATA